MTIHMPGPHGRMPESDAGLTAEHPAGYPPPEVMDRAYAAYHEAAGRPPQSHVGFIAAMIVAIQIQRGLDFAARVLAKPAPDTRCNYENCRHPYSEHIDPDACFAIDTGTACSCQGFRPA